MKFFLTSDIDKSARLISIISMSCTSAAEFTGFDAQAVHTRGIESIEKARRKRRRPGGKEIRSHLRICRKADSTLTFREPTSWRLFSSLLCHCCPCLPPSASSSSLFVLCATLDLHRFRRPTSRIRNLFTACGRDDHQQLIIAH